MLASAAATERTTMDDWRASYGDQAIAIVGMAGSFPGGRNLDAFWDMLQAGRHAIQQVSDEDLAAAGIPPSVYCHANYVRACTPLADFDRFDAGFFGFSPTEARMTDPQQRLFLQHCYLALEQSGYVVHRKDLAIGVFGGVGLPSYMIEYILPDLRDHTTATTSMPFAISNDKDYLATRVAFRLDLHGPALTVQTACSTSLVAVHCAVQSLLSRECDLALAGGASLRIPHRVGYVFQDGGILSRDGFCRSFDETATGTIFGGGVGVVALRRLEDAMAAGDLIRAVILGSAINNDGARKVGYAAPSVEGQVAVIAEALGVAGVEPDQVDYVEAHGTGTRIGDAIEATGLSRIFASRQRRDDRCLVGSVKSNVGHIEAAAGIVALIKTALAVERGLIPPSILATRPIAEIALDGPLALVTEGREWPNRGPRRIAGVSSFGIGGTNAHALISSPPRRATAAATRRIHVARLTARTPASLAGSARDMVRWLERNGDAPAAGIAASLDFGRPHYQYREAIAFENPQELAGALESAANRIEAGEARVVPRAAPKIAFCYSGQGAALCGAAAALYADSAIVARAIDRADELLCDRFDVPVRRILVEGVREPTEPRIVQPASVALQLALADLWASMGVKPAFVLGHSIGEISAAVASGLITAESALLFTAARGEAMERLCGEGAMLAVRAGCADVDKHLAPLAGIAVAACNSPSTTVLAGSPEQIGAAKEALAKGGIASAKLAVSRAYHSPQVKPAIAAVGEAAQLLVPGAGSSTTMISSLTGAAVTGVDILDPRHWQAHAEQPVQFEKSVREALGRGASAWLEIGAEPQLAVHVQYIVPDAEALTTLGSKDRSVRAVIRAGRSLYLSGATVDLVQAAPDTIRQAVGGYSFQLDRHWLERTEHASAPPAGAQTWTFSVGPARQPYLADHRIAGRIVVPGTFYVELAMAAARELFNAPGEVSDITFQQMLVIGEDEEAEVRLTVVPIGSGAATFSIERIIEGRPLHIASGKLAVNDPSASVTPMALRNSGPAMAVDSFYGTLAAGGIEYGPSFRGVSHLKCDSRGAFGLINMATFRRDEIDAYTLHPAALDCSVQIGGSIVMGPARMTRSPYLPIGIGRVRAFRSFPPDGIVEVIAERRGAIDADKISMDIEVRDQQGPIAFIEKLTMGKVRVMDGSRRSGAGFFRIAWSPMAEAAPADCSFELAAAPGDEFAGTLATSLREKGFDVVLGARDSAAAARRVVYIAPGNSEAGKSMVERAWQVCGPLLALTRSIPRADVSVSLTVLTRRAAALAGEPPDPVQAALWGCSTSIITERPDLNVRLIDVDGTRGDADLAALVAALIADSNENRIAIRDGVAMTMRLDPFVPEPQAVANNPDAVIRLELDRLGSLDELAFKSLPKPNPDRDEVLIKVDAAALNFVDIIAALGDYPDPAIPTILGSECAGVVEAAGADVSHVAVGDRVIAIAAGTIATYVIAKGFSVQKYDKLTPQEASTLQICYGTADYALRTIARLKSSESVLIHSATGGVGLAAISIARNIGARVIATAGSPAKREELHRRGITDVFDSRSTSFVDGVRQVTGGRGVDVVLNSLAGPLLEAGIDAMAPFGRFIDIAKRDIYTEGSIGLGPFRRNLTYSAFDLVKLCTDRPQELRSLIAQVLDRVGSGEYDRLPITLFPAESATDAFKLMARTRHIGKIVVDFASAPQASPRSIAVFRPDAAYVITGGFGALGMVIAARMVQGGARHLALIGRRGAGDKDEPLFDLIRATGCTLTPLALDIANAAAVEQALRTVAAERPIAGVVHAAGVLDDGPVEEMTFERFRAVADPKIGGLLALASILKPAALDFFVVFSSTSTIFAPPMQTSYTAANAAMEAVAEAIGASTISWGAWAGGGMATRTGTAFLGQSLGMPPMLVADATDAFARFLACGLDRSAVFATNPENLARGAGHLAAAPLFERLIAGLQSVRADQELIASLSAHDTRQGRIDAVAAYLAGEIEAVLGTPVDEVSHDQDFRSLGLDSLSALQLGKRMERRLGMMLDPTSIALHPTIASLAPVIAQKLGLIDDVADKLPPESGAKDRSEDAPVPS
jgi:acyl transferase domain-containing protein/NADPH:quinone reductase-like Zn-dependent oxidoreductase/acyl carrier protein